MKFLTLNTHSWMEEDAEGKFQTLKEQILKAQYDIICFQEVNQEIETAAVRNGCLLSCATISNINPPRSLCPFACGKIS